MAGTREGDGVWKGAGALEDARSLGQLDRGVGYGRSLGIPAPWRGQESGCVSISMVGGRSLERWAGAWNGIIAWGWAGVWRELEAGA